MLCANFSKIRALAMACCAVLYHPIFCAGAIELVCGGCGGCKPCATAGCMYSMHVQAQYGGAFGGVVWA